MKTATAKELRSRASEILDRVRKGKEIIITLRGKSVAVMRPVNEVDRPFSPIGFGMWKAHRSMKDIGKWLDERRRERYRR